MPIVYVHGVAVRDQQGNEIDAKGNGLLERLVKEITWDVVEAQLRRFIAPTISANPDTVQILQAYWGDVAAKLAWDGHRVNSLNSIRQRRIRS